MTANNQVEREKIASELYYLAYVISCPATKFKMTNNGHWERASPYSKVRYRKMANFIIQDRKRICEPLVKVNQTQWKDSDDRWVVANRLQEAIDQTLTLAGLGDN